MGTHSPFGPSPYRDGRLQSLQVQIIHNAAQSCIKRRSTKLLPSHGHSLLSCPLYPISDASSNTPLPCGFGPGNLPMGSVHRNGFLCQEQEGATATFVCSNSNPSYISTLLVLHPQGLPFEFSYTSSASRAPVWIRRVTLPSASTTPLYRNGIVGYSMDKWEYSSSSTTGEGVSVLLHKNPSLSRHHPPAVHHDIPQDFVPKSSFSAQRLQGILP